MESKEVVTMLTTIDNPFNPFENFESWFAFDLEKGYNTCSYLDRVVLSSEELSEKDQEFRILEAIDEIVEYNFLGIYRKVTPKSKFLEDFGIYDTAKVLND